MWNRQNKVWLLVFCFGLFAQTEWCFAQKADSLIHDLQELASFQRATSIESDAAGQIYIVDANASTISIFDENGTFQKSFGGPGLGDYEFDEPLDIDPTNGLLLFVADAGNSEIRKYSGEFLHLETILAQTADERNGETLGGRVGEDDFENQAEEGRPIAIAAAESGELFALESDRGVVLKWNSTKRLERSFGGIESVGESLEDPVDIALGKNGMVYVADQGNQSVFMFDWFGNFVGKLYEGLAVEIQSVSMVENYIALVLPKNLLFFEEGGRLIRNFEIDLDEDMVDMTAVKGSIFILTESRLLRIPWAS